MIISRREFLQWASAAAGTAAVSGCATGGASAGRVVVIGAGYGGATAAKYIKLWAPDIDVTVVERGSEFISCPLSNLVLGGNTDIRELTYSYDGLKRRGISIVRDEATAIDAEKREVRLAGGNTLSYDRLIVSPGVEFLYGGIPGLNNADAQNRVLHAWKAGAQTLALRKQLEAMPDGGVFALHIPKAPYRCPPGPYERAGLIAWYLQRTKPKSKLLVLDAKDTFSKQKLFQAAWKRLYPNTLEWVGLSDGGKIARADPRAGAVETDFQTHRGDVVNIIPPQRAGHIASVAGVADRTGWCPVDPATFESRLVPKIHVIGDAAIMGAMPKSAFAANAQAKVCALAVLRMLNGQAPDDPRLINTCYSLIAPNRAISVSGVYRPLNGLLADIDGAGGTSRLDATDETSALEATYADAWFTTVTTEAFG